jgi:hypothetical protein
MFWKEEKRKEFGRNAGYWPVKNYFSPVTDVGLCTDCIPSRTVS